MLTDTLMRYAGEHGPWIVLVFYLLLRDAQKDAATREALDKNSKALIELATLLKERTRQGWFG